MDRPVAIGEWVLHERHKLGVVTAISIDGPTVTYDVRFREDDRLRTIVARHISVAPVPRVVPEVVDPRPGDRVLHPKYGDGIVIAVRAPIMDDVCVRFEEAHRWVATPLRLLWRARKPLPDATIDGPSERNLLALLRGAGLEDPLGQYPVAIGDYYYFLDFAYPALRIGLEADGRIYHTSRESRERDRERDERLAELGWRIERFGVAEMEHGDASARLTRLGIPRRITPLPSHLGTRSLDQPPRRRYSPLAFDELPALELPVDRAEGDPDSPSDHDTSPFADLDLSREQLDDDWSSLFRGRND